MPISFKATAVAPTQAGYLQDITSDVQDQLDAKLSTTGTAANSSKIDGRTLFVAATEPTTGMSDGDIWIKTA